MLLDGRFDRAVEIGRARRRVLEIGRRRERRKWGQRREISHDDRIRRLRAVHSTGVRRRMGEIFLAFAQSDLNRRRNERTREAMAAVGDDGSFDGYLLPRAFRIWD